MNSNAIFRQAQAVMVAAALLSPTVLADEGMWTFDNPPARQLQDKYKFFPTQAWLDHVRLSCVRLNDGGSGSFVSPHGLLLTNHHVARGQLQKNSSREHNYVRDGFYAVSPEQEMKSPDLEVNVLVGMEDVTARVLGAVKGAKNVEEEFAKRKAVIADIERETTQKTGLRADVVSLYSGGEYWLYRYKKYTDVRLVFAPEQQIAFYGGDPDNFTYPRYDLDMALFRVYENGEPIVSREYLKWNPKGAADGELVFTSGHPGTTQRLSIYKELEADRDLFLPSAIRRIKLRIAVLRDYSARGSEQTRQAASAIFGLENSLKSFEGNLRGLENRNLMEKKRQEEERFKTMIMANPEWKRQFGGAWDDMARAVENQKPSTAKLAYRALDSSLAQLAYLLVAYVAEVKKPDGERMMGFHESQVESLNVRLFSPAPVYPEMDIARMSAALDLAQKELGPDDAWVKAVLDGRTPQQAASELVKGTKVGDPAFRKSLVEGGEAAVTASTDPMIAVARRIDPIRRELIKWFEANVQSVQERAGEQLGKARFAAFGKTTYPDATFTLRLSYGTVQGYPMNGTKAPSKTTMYGLYDRAAGFDNQGPFALPKRYLDGKDKLDLSTPFNFVTSNDVVGGNSGSPVINRDAEIVGLIFDGNIESLVGDYMYEETTNRAIAVHTAAMTEALKKLYGAQRLVDELMGSSK